MKREFNIIIAGDFCPKYRVQDAINQNDYTFLNSIQSLGHIDYSLLNLECPLISESADPINKCGPCLKSVRNAIEALKVAGFNGVTLANNHFRDFGDRGCISTLEILNSYHIDHVGGGQNLEEAQQILYKDINGCRVAFVNFCENEFSIATNDRAGAAPLDVVDNFKQITEAKQNADTVIVIVHGGHEMYQLPSPRMKKLYRFFVTIGADAVINHHQHCFSGYEVYNKKPIFYGLGNYCFDSKKFRHDIWNEGYMVLLHYDGEELSFELKPYLQCSDNVGIHMLEGNERIDFDNKIESLNDIISNDFLLQKNFSDWIKVVKENKLNVLFSYHNRYLNAAAARHWIPRLFSKKEIAAMLDHIECEAHRDITSAVLWDLLEKE